MIVEAGLLLVRAHDAVEVPQVFTRDMFVYYLDSRCQTVLLRQSHINDPRVARDPNSLKLRLL